MKQGSMKQDDKTKDEKMSSAKMADKKKKRTKDKKKKADKMDNERASCVPWSGCQGAARLGFAARGQEVDSRVKNADKA